MKVELSKALAKPILNLDLTPIDKDVTVGKLIQKRLTKEKKSSKYI